MSVKRRVVVTGMGIVSPLGVGTGTVIEKIFKRKSGIRQLTQPKYSKLPCRVAGVVPEDGPGCLNLDEHFSEAQKRTASKATMLALVAAHEALLQSKIIQDNSGETHNIDRERVGVSVGMGMLDLQDIQDVGNILQDKGYSRVSPYFIPRILPNQTTIKYGFGGPNHCASTSCATGAHAIGDAFNMIRLKYSDLMIYGGAESSISPLSISAFCRLQDQSTKFNDQPEVSSRPFAAQRDGFVNVMAERVSNELNQLSSSPSPAKKRVKRKAPDKSTVVDEYSYNPVELDETFPVTAYAVCDEFDLKDMHKGLRAQGLYIPTNLSEDLANVIHVTAKYPIGNEPREVFFFQEGAVVFWNVPYLEQINVLKFLRDYQDGSYHVQVVEDECEHMRYVNSEGLTRLIRGKIHLGNDSNTLLEKYAFANALASSVKLGVWESTLETFVDGIEHITEALKRAEKIKLSRAEVLQKTGELFALRHQLNLNSDLLDTPDFYWERERLETLYQKTCEYLSVYRRTKVMNEKLSQCCELLELISTHLTDQHHTRLEWMIIILIMIEVGFEVLHLLERYEFIQG